MARWILPVQNNPHVFEELKAEQRRLVAKRGAEINGSLLKEMVYADAVIRYRILYTYKSQSCHLHPCTAAL